MLIYFYQINQIYVVQSMVYIRNIKFGSEFSGTRKVVNTYRVSVCYSDLSMYEKICQLFKKFEDRFALASKDSSFYSGMQSRNVFNLQTDLGCFKIK